MFIATVIAGGALREGDISLARDALAAGGRAGPGTARWIEPGEAFDIAFTGDRTAARAALKG